ncbi:MAG: hypothetical protein KTR14_08195 [Vampirovibrio sp.]|nr:hypothetical protein [Vampirovibrio sp.]
MPLIIILLVLVGAVYQFFFRYDAWVDPKNPAIVYERDQLTGEIHRITPDDKISLTQRLLGDFGKQVNNSGLIEQSAGAPLPQVKAAIATNNAPVPASHQTVNAGNKKYQTPSPTGQPTETQGMIMAAIGLNGHPDTYQDNSPFPLPASIPDNKKDLNGDGIMETIIRERTVHDGLEDISVVWGAGKEVFYARGKQLIVLDTRTAGWSDLLLEVSDREEMVFHYNPAIDGYVAQLTH